MRQHRSDESALKQPEKGTEDLAQRGGRGPPGPGSASCSLAFLVFKVCNQLWNLAMQKCLRTHVSRGLSGVIKTQDSSKNVIC